MKVIGFRRRRRAALPLAVLLAIGFPALFPISATAREKALAAEKNPPAIAWRQRTAVFGT